MEGLKAWQAKQREATLRAAKEAITSLQSANQPVNFRSVAVASGLTRKTLYQIPELKALVMAGRSDEKHDEEGALQARIALLESENARLKTALREIRRKITPA